VSPGICGGRPCIAGHRIRVQDIVVMHEMRGMSPKEILAEYPSITLSDIHAALAYYFDHEDDIQEDFRKEDDLYDWGRANAPSKIPAELRKKLGG